MTTGHRIGITLGDPHGIGPEVTLKALDILKDQTTSFLLYGTSDGFESACQISGIVPSNCHFIPTSGPIEAIKQAADDILHDNLDAIVTGPVSKEAACAEEPTFRGHTEYLAKLSDADGSTMLFVADDLKVAQVTTHISLAEVTNKITPDLLGATIDRTIAGLKQWWNLQNPRIAICGINPHAGEQGLFGTEETEVLLPVIREFQRKGEAVIGPFGADTILTSPQRKKYDAVVAMYHDQLLPAVKIYAENHSVNMTLGLPFLRTSVDHGVAYDIYGQNSANPSSMISAIQLAIKLLNQRDSQ